MTQSRMILGPTIPPEPPPDTPEVDPGMGNCTVCARPVKPGFLMCYPHWSKVPHHLQTKVGHALAAFRTGGSLEALRTVQNQATAYVLRHINRP